ncbi:MAG: restriction endonuclease subunit S [Candidatus Accumulibacter propinquus]
MNEGQIGSFILPCPNPPEQTAIAAFLDRETAKIDDLVAEQRNLIGLLKEKRQALISHAVTKGLDPAVPMKNSGVEWLGEVPAHWQIGPLKRFADIVDCKHYTVQFLDEGWPIVSIRELHDDRIDISNAKLTSLQEWEFLREGRAPLPGDMIFCRNASVGAVGYVESDASFCMGQDVCLIRSLSVGRFMHYQMMSTEIRNQIEALLVGATIRRANVEEIRSLVVVWPAENEQNAIAAFLSHETAKIDDLITEAEIATNLLQERRTALISAAVTGKIDVRNRMTVQPVSELEVT